MCKNFKLEMLSSDMVPHAQHREASFIAGPGVTECPMHVGTCMHACLVTCTSALLVCTCICMYHVCKQVRVCRSTCTYIHIYIEQCEKITLCTYIYIYIHIEKHRICLCIDAFLLVCLSPHPEI